MSTINESICVPSWLRGVAHAQKMAAAGDSASQVQWGKSENGGIRKVGVASPMGRTRKWRRPKSRRRKSNGANQKMAASAEWCRKSNGANQKMAASEKSVSQVQWGESENGGVRNVGVASPMGRIRKCGVRKVGVASPVGRNRKWRHPQSRCRKSNGAKQKMAACAELVSQLILLPGHC